VREFCACSSNTLSNDEEKQLHDFTERTERNVNAIMIKQAQSKDNAANEKLWWLTKLILRLPHGRGLVERRFYNISALFIYQF
jgi:hypothetical protein